MIFARIFVTLCAVYFFVIYLPILLVKSSLSMDVLNANELISGLLSWRLFCVFGLFGLFLSLWTVFVQVKRGLGTPLSGLPPAKLLVDAPYSYCRNPMALGGIIFYFGICVFIGSWKAFYIVTGVAALILSYIKFLEERELESRFGQPYIEYKRQMPFLIPRIFGKRWYFLFLH